VKEILSGKIKPIEKERLIRNKVVTEGGNGADDIDIDPLLTIETELP